MAGSTTLTTPEREFVEALNALSVETRAMPRRDFAGTLRDTLVARAQQIEMEEAEAFQLALEGETAEGPLAELASFASGIAAAEAPRVPGVFRLGLRTQLSNVKVENLRAPAAKGLLAGFRRRKLVLAASISMMMASSTASAFAAAANDTPADMLFGLKRFGERAGTWFVSGPEEGVKRLGFAERRIDETDVMLEKGITEAAPYSKGMGIFQLEVTTATDLILEGHEASDPAAVEGLPELASFLTRNYERVQRLADAVPDAARTDVTTAITTLEEAAHATEAAVDGCIICPDGTVREPNGQTGTCTTCPTDTPSGPGTPGILPTPGPGQVGQDPVEPPVDPPVNEQPSAPPVPTEVPRPDRVPDLPGRWDDDLEEPVGELTELLLRIV